MGSASFPWHRGAFGVLLSAILLSPFLAVGAVPDDRRRPPRRRLASPRRRRGQQSVVIRGNRRIEAETILAYMDLKPGQKVTAEDLNRAVRRLFDTGLFRDVQIIPEDNQLIVEVVENPSINEIAFEGNDALSDEDLQQIISLRPRLPFTVSAAEADAQAIVEVYRRTGRYGAEVEPVIIERSDNRVDLVFEINEGKLTGVSAIDFVGNQVYLGPPAARRHRDVGDAACCPSSRRRTSTTRTGSSSTRSCCATTTSSAAMPTSPCCRRRPSWRPTAKASSSPSRSTRASSTVSASSTSTSPPAASIPPSSRR